jgi:hypothetical protein
MSRYTVPHPTDQHVNLSYGFDGPLSQYFFVVTDSNPAIPEEKRGVSGKVLAGDLMGPCTTSDLLHQMVHVFGLTTDHPHVIATASDLSF